MKIKELNLIGFGQFNNKFIELDEGLNIIYGENEAGKTTLHSFINGMFYGFLKPYAKRTIYTEEHDRYNPWHGPRYSGLVKFTYDGKEYRIERDFTKNKESTNVFLDETGEDITKQIDNGDAGRVLQPGHHFFGFNDAVFSNTLSIKQLGSKTENYLANEVRDKLVNVSNSLDDNLSIEKAIEELDRSVKDIGSDKATSKPYGKAVKRLERLKARKTSILEDKDEYNELLAKKDSFDNDLTAKKVQIKELEKKLADANILEKNKIYIEANNLKDQILQLEKIIEDNKKYQNLSMDDYSSGIDLKRSILNIEEKIQENEKIIIELDDRIKELEINKVKVDQSLTDLDRDYQRYEELEEEKKDLRYNDYNSELQFISKDYDENIDKKKKIKFVPYIGLALILISLALESISPILMTGVSLTGLISVIYSLTSLRRIKRLLRRIDSQYKDIEKKEETRVQRIKCNEESLEEILSKYRVRSKLELKRLMDKTQYDIFNKEERKKNLNENIGQKEDIINKTNMLKEENQANKKELEKILKKNHSKDFEEFKIALEKKDIYKDSLRELSAKKDLIRRILADNDLETLKNETISYDKDISSIDQTLTIEKLENDISLLNDERNTIKIKISRYEERVNYLNKEISQLVEIDEDIDRLVKFLTKSDNQKKALDLAKTTIQDISKDIHRQFAPAINEKVGRIIEDITDGKYSSVKIDNSLEIGVINPDTDEIVDIKSLSGGTIDQLYFALRFGIVDSINDSGLPLILDDCFIQYDNNRLKKIMEFLYKKSKERQIILFTCHKREDKILDEMKIEYNLINLNS